MKIKQCNKLKESWLASEKLEKINEQIDKKFYDIQTKLILYETTKWHDEVFMGIKNAEGEKVAFEFYLIGVYSPSDPFRDSVVAQSRDLINSHLDTFRERLTTKVFNVGTANLLPNFKCSYLKEYEG